MPPERGTRKLAAIMFTDIKSFSKKMSENEELAMQLLRIHDDTLKAIIEKYEGKIIKAIGDAFMVDFSSAVNAVKCAIESQEVFYAYNKGKEELEKIEVRMGIHLGDVITDGNDIFGDGVNIASRIEAVTEPNRICISQDVYSQIKNKMQVKTYHMGSIQLKNIAEPVEVYEVLLDSIPEFSVPSKAAQQMPTKRATEKATKREAKEAEQVEEKRKAEEERQKAEREKVEALYRSAEKLVAEGRLGDAEKELNELFKLVAFHAGAQVLQGKIEEEREKKSDEERKRKAAKAKIDQRIQEYMAEALSMVENDNFSEAELKVQEIYKIDPDHQGARELEAQIIEARKAKEELERKRSEADVALPAAVDAEESSDEQPVEDEVQPATQAPEAEPAPHRAPAPARRSAGLRQRRKRVPRWVPRVAAAAVVVVLGVMFFPEIEKFIIPRDATIVVAPFEVQPGPDTTSLGAAVAGVLADDLARYKELTVIRAGTALNLPPRPIDLARSVQARYILTGRITSFSPRWTVTLILQMRDVQAIVWEEQVESVGPSLAALKETTARKVLESLEIEQSVLPSSSSSSSPMAMVYHLAGLGSLSALRRDDAQQAAAWFRQAIDADTSFAEAYVGLGRALMRIFRTEGERDKDYLRQAVDVALAARAFNAALPGVYEVLGSAYRSAGRLEQAEQNLDRALDLEPGNAEASRQLAMVALTRGDYEKAVGHAERAMILDPRHPDSHEVMGHAQYFRQQYNSAEASYNQAIALGNSPFLITTRYKIAVWGAGLSPDPVAEYCTRLLKDDPANYVVNYWIGRAYMLSGFWQQAKGYLESGLEILQGIIERDPNDVQARGYAALYAARLGESAKGLEQVEKAVELSGGSALSLYRKAQFYAIQADKKAEALEWLGKAVNQEFILWEIMSPDFAFIAKEPEFRKAVSVVK
ncbi:MAG: tetratricopeptide repeat protein [Ignavibacterium sp.]|jgi:class 3 adenylate cyclase/TolB-like protein